MIPHISVKRILLILTLLLAIHARLFIIPRLNADNLPRLAWHIIAVTLLAVALLFTG